MGGRLLDITQKEYHAQSDSDIPRLTYSTMKNIIQKSPLHAYRDHSKLGGNTRKATKSMDQGTILHELILGNGSGFATIDYPDFKTKAARELRDLAYEQGLTPVIKKDLETYKEIACRVKKQLEVILPEFFTPHLCEAALEWDYQGILSQSLLDWVSPDLKLIIDLKITTDVSPDKVTRKIIDMGYDIQEYFYSEAAHAVWPSDRPWKFIFLFIENQEPYSVVPYTTDSQFEVLGQSKVERAAATFAKCLASGEWPSYEPQKLFAPAWAVTKELIENEAE